LRLIDGGKRLLSCGWDAEQLLARDSYWAKLVRAVDLDLRGGEDAYSAMHSLSDFVSGMTDRYALKIRNMVTGRL